MRVKKNINELIPSEHAEQCIVIKWAELMSNQNPRLSMLYAIPNAAKRSYFIAARMKSEGMKSGVPDLCLPVASSGYHGLYIELKRVKKSTTSENQNKWLDMLNRENYLAIVCKGADEAIAALKGYLCL